MSTKIKQKQKGKEMKDKTVWTSKNGKIKVGYTTPGAKKSAPAKPKLVVDNTKDKKKND